MGRLLAPVAGGDSRRPTEKGHELKYQIVDFEPLSMQSRLVQTLVDELLILHSPSVDRHHLKLSWSAGLKRFHPNDWIASGEADLDASCFGAGDVVYRPAIRGRIEKEGRHSQL
jgi:hypothetical protein